jgi:putative pyruvate formate lyase activating enzyme
LFRESAGIDSFEGVGEVDAGERLSGCENQYENNQSRKLPGPRNMYHRLRLPYFFDPFPQQSGVDAVAAFTVAVSGISSAGFSSAGNGHTKTYTEGAYKANRALLLRGADMVTFVAMSLILSPADEYSDCILCPRACRVDRGKNGRGFCGESAQPRLAVATLHRGEEPPLTTGAGSGALFFSGCTLGCSDCQNCQLSRGETGAAVSADELSEIMLCLQREGASNINIVTGTHFTPSLAEAVKSARNQGLSLPIVWNTSGFETPRNLELLDGWVDIYLTDLKTLSRQLAEDRMGRADYPDRIRAALPLMLKGRALSYRGEALVRGVIVRHLVLPYAPAESLEVIRWFGSQVGGRALFSLMTQYIDPRGTEHGESLGVPEYELLTNALDEAGIEEGFVQEPEKESGWLPDFTRSNPFPADYSRPVWHWREGFVIR